jgi:tetratricopeptide (TPR) repeat protein
VRHGGFKLIEAPRPELYDLRADPSETHDLIAANPAKAAELRGLLERAESRPASAARAVDDPQALERLRALGYVGGASQGAPPPPASGLRDPKDGAELRALLTEGDQLLRSGRPAAALVPLERALARDPDNRFALQRTAAALAESGRLPRALGLLQRLVRLDPRSADALAALAATLVRAKQPGASVEHWREAARLQPRRADVWANLGAALGLSGREPEAAEALAEAVRLEPTRPDLLIKLALAQAGARRPADAVATLLRAAERTGAEAFPQSAALGILLAETNRPEEARSWLRRARPQEGDFPEARFRLAQLEAQAGRQPEARAALAEALRATPSLRARASADPRLRDLLP